MLKEVKFIILGGTGTPYVHTVDDENELRNIEALFVKAGEDTYLLPGLNFRLKPEAIYDLCRRYSKKPHEVIDAEILRTESTINGHLEIHYRMFKETIEETINSSRTSVTEKELILLDKELDETDKVTIECIDRELTRLCGALGINIRSIDEEAKKGELFGMSNDVTSVALVENYLVKTSRKTSMKINKENNRQLNLFDQKTQASIYDDEELVKKAVFQVGKSKINLELRNGVINEYELDQMFNRLVGGRGLDVWLGIRYLMYKTNKDYADINIRDFAKSVLNIKEPNNAVLDQISQTIKLFASAEFSFEKQGKGMRIYPLHIWTEHYDTMEQEDWTKPGPITYEDLRERTTDLRISMHPDLCKGLKDRYVMLSLDVVQIDRNKHPYAKQLIVYLSQCFRMPTERAQGYKALKTETIFDKLEIPKASKNLSRTFSLFESEVVYLKEEGHIKDYALTQEGPLLERTWQFYPNDETAERLKEIADNRAQYLLQEKEKEEQAAEERAREKQFSMITPEYLQKLMDENNLSLGQFAQQLGYDKGNLSKVLKRKVGVTKSLKKLVADWLNKMPV